MAGQFRGFFGENFRAMFLRLCSKVRGNFASCNATIHDMSHAHDYTKLCTILMHGNDTGGGADRRRLDDTLYASWLFFF